MRTREEIIAEYDALIAAAEEEVDKLRLEAEKQTKINEWWQAYDAQRTLDGAKQEAIKKYPRAASAPGAVTGSTPEELEASAKAVHEAIEAQVAEEVKQRTAAALTVGAAQQPQGQAPVGALPIGAQQAAQQAWGQPTASPAGAPQQTPETAETERIWEGLREAYPKNFRGPHAPGTSKLKEGDDIRIADLRMNEDWDRMMENSSRRAPERAPSTTR